MFQIESVKKNSLFSELIIGDLEPCSLDFPYRRFFASKGKLEFSINF